MVSLFVYGFVCVLVHVGLAEEDVLALAGKRQTAVGQYCVLGGVRTELMLQSGRSIYIHTELPTQHT